MKDRKRKTVWAVEDGEYSAYHVVGVFSTKANAELVRAATKADGGVVEWELDPAVGELRKGLKRWAVLMLRDGTVESVKGIDPSVYGNTETASIWRRTQAPAYVGKGIPDVLRTLVWARTESQAIKATNETRVQMIAAGRWR